MNNKFLQLAFVLALPVLGADYTITNAPAMGTRLSQFTNINVAVELDGSKPDSVALFGSISNAVTAAGWTISSVNATNTGVRPGVFARAHVPGNVTRSTASRFQRATDALCDELNTNQVAAVQMIYRPLTNGLGPRVHLQIGTYPGVTLTTNMARYSNRHRVERVAAE